MPKIGATPTHENSIRFLIDMISLENIADSYLRSFKVEQDEKKVQKPFKRKKLKDLIKAKELAPPVLNKREQAEVLFTNIFNESNALKGALDVEEPVIDRGSWDDFNLIYGNTTTPDQTLHTYINRTRTVAGACVMATELVNPQRNVETIQNKQKVAQLLIKEKNIAKALDDNLALIQKDESVRLSLWKKKNSLNHTEYESELNTFYFKRFGLKKYNQSTWVLQFGKIWKDIWGHWGFRCLLISLVIFLGYAYFFPRDFIEAVGPHISAYNWFQKIFYTIYSDLLLPGCYFFYPLRWQHFVEVTGYDSQFSYWWQRWQEYIMYSQEDPKLKATLFKLVSYNAADLAPFLLGCLFTWLYYKKIKKNSRILNFLAAHLATLQDFLITAQNISKLVRNHPDLEKLYGKELVHTRKLLQRANKSTPEGALLYNLKVSSLKGPYYFFNNTGRLLATYKLFEEYKTCFADALYELGKLDTQLSVVKLVKEAKAYSRHGNHYVFSEVIATMEKGHPMIVAQQMWNPGLDAKKAVANDLEMKNLQLLIITGPNAGGKSTYTIGAGLLVLLSQVYGIAPAKHCKHTLFYKILSYVNPTQNLAAGLSLAEAGMEVLKIQKDTLDRMKDKSTLAIMDEILNGVDIKIGEEYSYKILKSRYDKVPNLIQILTTHYRKLTELEKNEKVVNKRVDLIIPGKNGRKFDYTYQIVDGIAPEAHNVVQDMLKMKGIL